MLHAEKGVWPGNEAKKIRISRVCHVKKSVSVVFVTRATIRQTRLIRIFLASFPGHTHFSMLHAEKGVWPGNEAKKIRISRVCHVKKSVSVVFVTRAATLKSGCGLGTRLDFLGSVQTWTLDWTHGLDCGLRFGDDHFQTTFLANSGK